MEITRTPTEKKGKNTNLQDERCKNKSTTSFDAGQLFNLPLART